MGPVWISSPSWYQKIVKGGEPDTLHSISPAPPTTVLESFNVLEKVGGMILSDKQGNGEVKDERF